MTAISSPTRRFSFALGLIFLAQSALAYSPEINFWAERQRTAEKNRSDVSPQLASLPNIAQFKVGHSGQLAKSLPHNFASKHAGLLSALPVSYGNVQKISLPQKKPTEKTIIHIQDIHLNQEAQKNIASTIQELINKGQVDLIALEGATEPIDLSGFRSYPNQNTIRKVADYLLKKNKITGPIHTAFVSPKKIPPIVGIDDPTHYNANIEAYRKSSQRQTEYKRRLEEIKRGLESAKAEIFNPALRAFDTKVQAYRSGQILLGTYIQALVQKNRLSKTLEVKNFLDALTLEKKLDFNTVELERGQLIEKLTRHLSKEQIDVLVSHSMAYHAGQLRYADFYRWLRHFCEESGIGLTQYPSMDRFIQYVLLADTINAETLFQQMTRLEKKAYNSLTKKQDEHRLIEESRRLYLTQKLLEFSLTAEEWEEYQSLMHQGEKQFDLSSFEAFYTEAATRDKAMAHNLLKLMNARNIKTAVLVTGGFHSRGMDSRLVAAGFTTLTFTPKIEKIDSKEGTAYLSVFTQEKTPLEKLFAGKKLFLTPNPMNGAKAAPFLTIAGDAWTQRSLGEIQQAHQKLRQIIPKAAERISVVANKRDRNTVELEITYRNRERNTKGKTVFMTVIMDDNGEIVEDRSPIPANNLEPNTSATDLLSWPVILAGSYGILGWLAPLFNLSISFTYMAFVFGLVLALHELGHTGERLARGQPIQLEYPKTWNPLTWRLSIKNSPGYAGLLTNIVLALGAIWLLYHPSLFSPAFLLTFSILNILMALTQITDIRDTMRRIKWFTILVINRDKSFESLFIRILKRKYYERYGKDVSTKMISEAIASFFAVEELLDKDRNQKSAEILKHLFLDLNTSTRDKYIDELIEVLPEITWTMSTTLRHTPLILALANILQGNPVLSGQLIQNLIDDISPEFDYLRTTFMTHGNPFNVRADWTPNQPESPVLPLPKMDGDNYRWLYVGPAPKGKGSRHLELLKRAGDSFSPNGSLDITGAERFFPPYYYEDNSIKRSVFHPEVRPIDDRFVVNGINYANAQRPRNNVTNDQFNMGTFDFISLIMSLHTFAQEGEDTHTQPLNGDFEWINENGEDISPKVQFKITDTQRDSIERLLLSLNENGGYLFIHINQGLSKHGSLIRAIKKNDGLLLIMRREGKKKFRLYNTAIPFRPESIPYSSFDFILNREERYLTLKNPGLRKLYASQPASFFDELSTLFHAADLLLWRNQGWNKSVWGQLQNAASEINKGAGANVIMTSYLSSIPDSNPLKSNILSGVQRLVDRYEASPDPVDNLESNTSATDLFSWPVILAGSYGILGWVAPQFNLSISFIYMALVFGLVLALHELGHTGERLARGQPIQLEYPKTWNPLMWKFSIKDSPGYAGLLTNIVLALGSIWLLYYPSLFSPAFLLTFSILNILMALTQITDIRDTMRRIKWFIILVINRDKSFESLFVRILTRKYKERHGKDITRNMLLEAIASFFAVEELLDKGRNEKSIEILKHLFLDLNTSTRDKYIDELIEALPEITWTMSTTLRHTSLILALANILQGKPVLSGQLIQNLIDQISPEFDYLRTTFMTHGNPFNVSADWTPNQPESPVLPLPKMDGDNYRWLYVGPAPKGKGSRHLELLKRTGDSFSPNGSLDITGADRFFPPYYYEDNSIKKSVFHPEVRPIDDRFVVNGINYANAQRPRNNVTNDQFNMGTFDFISLIMSLHTFAQKREKTHTVSLGRDFEWIDENGEDISPKVQFKITDTQRDSIERLLLSLNENGGYLFIHINQGLSKHGTLIRAIKKNDGLLLIMRREGKKKFRLYNTAIPFRPEPIPYSSFDYILDGREHPLPLRNLGFRKLYASQPASFFDELSTLFHVADLLLWRNQGWDQSVWGHLQNAIAEINKGADANVIMASYLGSIPDSNTLKLNILNGVQNLVDRYDASPISVDHSQGKTSATDLLSWPVILAGSYVILGWLAPQFNLSISFIYMALVFGLVLALHELGHTGERLARGQPIQLEYPKTWNPLTWKFSIKDSPGYAGLLTNIVLALGSIWLLYHPSLFSPAFLLTFSILNILMALTQITDLVDTYHRIRVTRSTDELAEAYADTTARIVSNKGLHSPATFLKRVMPPARNLQIEQIDGNSLNAINTLANQLKSPEFKTAFSRHLGPALKKWDYSSGSVAKPLLYFQNFIGRGTPMGSEEDISEIPVLMAVVTKEDLENIDQLIASQIKAFGLGGEQRPHVVLVPSEEDVAQQLRKAYEKNERQNVHLFKNASFVEVDGVQKLDIFSLNHEFEEWRRNRLRSAGVRVTLSAPKEMLSPDLVSLLPEDSSLRDAIEILLEILKQMPVTPIDLKNLLDLAILIAKQA